MHPGARSVTDIDAAEIIAVLSPLWRTMTVTAQRLRQRIGIVLKTATALYSLVPRQAAPCFGRGSHDLQSSLASLLVRMMAAPRGDYTCRKQGPGSHDTAVQPFHVIERQ